MKSHKPPFPSPSPSSNCVSSSQPPKRERREADRPLFVSGEMGRSAATPGSFTSRWGLFINLHVVSWDRMFDPEACERGLPSVFIPSSFHRGFAVLLFGLLSPQGCRFFQGGCRPLQYCFQNREHTHIHTHSVVGIQLIFQPWWKFHELAPQESQYFRGLAVNVVWCLWSLVLMFRGNRLGLDSYFQKNKKKKRHWVGLCFVASALRCCDPLVASFCSLSSFDILKNSVVRVPFSVTDQSWSLRYMQLTALIYGQRATPARGVWMQMIPTAKREMNCFCFGTPWTHLAEVERQNIIT